MNRNFLFLTLCLMLCCTSCQPNRIPLTVLREKIAGAWIGQMVGNMYGLPHENKYIEAPGDSTLWPYGYSKSLDKLARYEGAFSDDDTDMEYLYLIMMEKYGCEPSYQQIREGWMHHVRDRIWLANRAALGLMHHGFTPPYTGMKAYNPHWYQIDPQLINEIWAYTAPGMTAYAAEKSAWAARITSDDWAVVPTIHYGAMYAMAFFESNMEKLVIDAIDYLPEGDRYRNTVRECVELYRQYPNDWTKARAVIAEKDYLGEDEMTRTIWNANLNGAMGILSMLYGHGDLQRTMDIGCALGFDCDNQTATIGGILGVIYGASSFSDALTKPIEGWTEPFNNRYVNITRFDMPDTSVDDLIDRTLSMAIKVVCANGGRLVGKGDKACLVVNRKAVFQAPMEYCQGPMPILEVNVPHRSGFGLTPYPGRFVEIAEGELPEGLRLEDGILEGTPVRPGRYPVELMVVDRNTGRTCRDNYRVEFIVRERNIAPTADTIYASVREVNKDVLYRSWITFGKPMYADKVEVINDGVLDGPGSVFYSLAEESRAPKSDYFGYGWKHPRRIGALAYHAGCLEEFGGWYQAGTLKVQYLDAKGRWTDVTSLRSTPALPATDIVFFQPHFAEFYLEFDPVETTGIRLIGDDKVQDHWHAYTKNVSSFISITELSAYESR